MKLQEIFDILTYGELSQISIGGSEAGVIKEADYPRVLSHISLGLNTLYKRFYLKEGIVNIRFLSTQTDYKLDSLYAVSNVGSTAQFKHILDSGSPFIDDVLKVEKVLTDNGFELELNDSSDEYSIITPTTLCVRIPKKLVAQGFDLPDAYKTTTFDVYYRAKHPRIEPEDLDPEAVEVELPDSYLEALLYFVASRVNNPIGMVGEFNAGNNYSAKYELACKHLENSNLHIDRGSQNTRLLSKGFV
jgi:hypothetical protein